MALRVEREALCNYDLTEEREKAKDQSETFLIDSSTSNRLYTVTLIRVTSNGAVWNIKPMPLLTRPIKNGDVCLNTNQPFSITHDIVIETGRYNVKTQKAELWINAPRGITIHRRNIKKDEK